MTFKQELATAAVRGFMMGVGVATLLLAFLLIVTIIANATGRCQ